MLEALDPPSSVAVAAADKAAARARRDIEHAQDYQCFIRQESARVFASLVAAEVGVSYGRGLFQLAEESVRAANELWMALPPECKL